MRANPATVAGATAAAATSERCQQEELTVAVRPDNTYLVGREPTDDSMKKPATKLPRMMPWGWRHAYLNDPDGHEISLYWAGENRMKKTMMRVAGLHAKAATQSR
jgi:hypothetical protein